MAKTNDFSGTNKAGAKYKDKPTSNRAARDKAKADSPPPAPNAKPVEREPSTRYDQSAASKQRSLAEARTGMGLHKGKR